MALGAQHASPCAPGRRRARIALETQPLPAALPAAVLRIALGLSITQRAAAADAVPTAQTARSALQPRTQCPVAHARRCGRRHRRSPLALCAVEISWYINPGALVRDTHRATVLGGTQAHARRCVRTQGAACARKVCSRWRWRPAGCLLAARKAVRYGKPLLGDFAQFNALYNSRMAFNVCTQGTAAVRKAKHH